MKTDVKTTATPSVDVPRLVRLAAIDLLEDCFADEIEHLRLRLIRDEQSPRFEALRESHPEIWRDFSTARSGPHEVMLRNRRKRVEILTKLAEGVIEPNAKDEAQPHAKNYE